MKKVLVVDDTKNIRNMFITCMELEGYDVDVASNGKEALEKVRIKHYDLIFLDIKLPEISGTEVLRIMRREGILTPTVIMTAFATVKNAIECTQMGAVTYLQKPFSLEKIRSVLSEILRSANNEQRLIDILNKSIQLIDKDELSAAFELLKKGLAIDPECSDIYENIAILYEKKGDSLRSNKYKLIAQQFSMTDR